MRRKRIKQQSTVDTEINHIHSTVNKEKAFKVRDVSISLIDIAKSYKKQEENLTKALIKHEQKQSSMHSNSAKDMHNEKSTAHLDYYDNNNNSKETVPKCIITENVVYSTPKYVILTAEPQNSDKEEDEQEIFKSLERKKCRLSSKEGNALFSNLLSFDNSKDISTETNITQDTISEYNPTDETQSSEINKINTEISANSESNINEISNVSEKYEYNQFKFNVPGNSACDESELTAELSQGPKGDNKKNFCVFCHTLQSKIARHLENKHCDEDQVKDFINLPKGCSQRFHKIVIIRKEGNFIFNATKEYNHGRMITVRRPTQEMKQSGTNFTNCCYRNGIYVRNNLRHHNQQGNENEKSSCSQTISKCSKSSRQISLSHSLHPLSHFTFLSIHLNFILFLYFFLLLKGNYSDSDISNYVMNTSSSSSDEGTVKVQGKQKNQAGRETYRKKKRWTKEEITDAKRYFSKYIYKGKLPPLSEIEKIKMTYNILSGRKPDVIKTWLHNQLKKNKSFE